MTWRWVGGVWSGYRETIFFSIGIAHLPAARVHATYRCSDSLCAGEATRALGARRGGTTGDASGASWRTAALALIVTYGGVGHFRTSWLLILVGHVLFTLPFMVRSVLAVIMAIDLKTLEEGAAWLGAGFRHRFFHVVLPNCRSVSLRDR